MKTKKNQKKLSLQKETVASLNTVEMSQVYGQCDLAILSNIFTNCLVAVVAIDDNPDDVRPSKGCAEK